MFGRSEQSEWGRFSRAFPAKQEPKGQGEDEENVAASDPEPAHPPGPNERPPAALLGAAAVRPVADSPPPAPRAAASLSAAPMFSEEVESTIGPSAFVDGTYRCESGLRICGTAKGEIESTKTVFIEESAKVSAKVTAATIIVAGEVNGELVSTGRVEIRPSGHVTGSINASTLVMQEGAFFDGNLKMRPTGAEVPAST